jgi:general secretion pathway protein L
MRILGLDIGSYSLKLVEIDSSSGRVVQYLEHVFNPDPGRDRHIEVVDFMRSQLGGTLAGAQIVVGLRQNEVTHRRVRFPFRERFKIEKSLAFELEDDMPFSSDNAVFEFKVIGYDGPTADILALAAPKATIASTLAGLRDMGVEPHVLSMEGAALNNLLESWSDLPPSLDKAVEPTADAPVAEAQAILYLGHSHAVLAVRSDGRWIDLKTFDGGGLEIARSVATAYSLPLAEAIKQVNAKAFVLLSPQGATKDQVAFSDVFKKALDPLVQNIRLALLDVQSQWGVQINSMHLLGGLTGIRNLHPWLAQNLSLTVYAETPQPIGIDTTLVAFDWQRGSLALGLAMEGLRKARNPAVTFLRGEYRRENKTLKNFLRNHGKTLRYSAAIYAIVLGFAVARDLVSTHILTRADSALTEQGRQMKLRSSRLRADAAKRIAAHRESERQREFIQSLSGVVSALDVLKDLSVKAPARDGFKLDLQSLAIDGRQVQVTGSLPADQRLARWTSALQGIAKGPVQATEGATSAGRRSFILTFNVERLKGTGR